MFTPPIAHRLKYANEINFGPDKSQILRGIAIIFMITLHNNMLPEFKICVPIFTFLVGYGYSFAKVKDIRHGLKRSWHLLSHFWLILIGLFLPIAIWFGNYNPTRTEILLNMFGLVSNLNYYSWYIYFYLYAMIIMIPCSRLIDKYRIKGLFAIIVLSLAICFVIRKINNWSDNIWLQAMFDCFLCSPVMFVGYLLAHYKLVGKIKIPHNIAAATLLTIIAVIAFFLRGIPYSWIFDFIIVPIFVIAVVGLFNILATPIITNTLKLLGKESMNMWFFHAIFETACTAVVFAPLVEWIQPKFIHIIAVIIISYLASRILSTIYKTLGAGI